MADDRKKPSTVTAPQSFGARVAQAIRYTFTGNADWFSPEVPLDPVAPPEIAGRRWDMPVGINFQIRPRAYEPIGFAELRNFADPSTGGYDLMRLVIETRKDQVVGLEWSIQPRDLFARKAKGGAHNDKRAQKVEEFLRQPDRDHNWADWVRILLEDMLVIDAATIYPRKTIGGDLYALDIIDGATIEPFMDNWGRTPMPPAPAYQQVLKGVPAVQYRRDELLYLPRNLRSHRIYGMSPVEQVVTTVNIALRRQISQLQFYTEGNIPDTIFGVPENWSPQQIAEFEQYWNSVLAGNTAARRQGKFVPGGVKPYNMAEGRLKDEYDDWLARIVCYAFSVSAQWAVKQMNRSTAETADSQAIKEGLEPIKAWIKGVIDRLLREVWGYPDLEMVWQEEVEVKAAEQAQINNIYVRAGIKTPNEVRAELGLDPLPEGDRALIYTATGAIPLDVAIENADNPPPPPPMLGHNGGMPLEDGMDTEAPAGTPASRASGREKRDRAPAKKPGAASDDDEDTIERRDRSLRGIWRRFLTAAAARVAEAAGTIITRADGETDDPAQPANGTGALPPDIDAAIASLPWQAVEAETAEALSEAAAQAAQNAMTAESGGSTATAAIQINLADPDAAAWAAAHAADLVTDIEATTRERIASLVAQVMTGDLTNVDLPAAIQQAGAFSAERAGLIAETEGSRAFHMGHLIGWRTLATKYGVSLKKIWVLGAESHSCPVCEANALIGPIALDREFPSGDQAPPEHPNCNCDLHVIHYSADEVERAFDPDQPRDAHGRWTGGIGSEIAKGMAAIEAAITHKTDVHDAMTVKDIGRISFIWGQPGNPEKAFSGGYGLSKIIAKHGEAAARKIPEVLARGTHSGIPTRQIFRHDGYRVTLTRGGKGTAGPWVLSSYVED